MTRPPRRSFGNVRKLPSGRWQAQYRWRGRGYTASVTFSCPGTGRCKTDCAGVGKCAGWRNADAELGRIRRELESGKLDPDAEKVKRERNSGQLGNFRDPLLSEIQEPLVPRMLVEPGTFIFILYRFFAKSGELLYVGQTADPNGRRYAHLRPGGAPWRTEVSQQMIEVWRFTARSYHAAAKSIELVEANAIAKERPRYNKVGVAI